MKQRTMTVLAILVVAIGAALLVPHAAFACQITEPGCYIQDFSQQQLAQFNLSVWQLNRAGLVLARWLEDLRGWLTDSVLVSAFTALTKPVAFLFVLALIVAWLVFVVSFMVQSLIELRWVDLRRALRPILLALLIFSCGGALLKASEDMRVLVGTLLQQAAQAAVQIAQAPPIPTTNTGDMPDATMGIYSDATVCGTAARSVSTLSLNDYSARYLWANANDIHCAELAALADEFAQHYFPYGQNIADANDAARQDAVALATEGGLRQVTGLLLSSGAIIEQLMQLLFALALGLIWFALLLALVFAVFLPTEALFASQLRAILSVLRASWQASFLIGIGLALLQVVAASGNGALVLNAVCIWQTKQALGTLGSAVAAVGAASGGAPQAVGGMLKGWATTAALVAGVAAGGVGAVLGSVGSTLVRRAGRSMGDNPLSQAAGRVLTNRVADRIDSFTQDQRLQQDADLNLAEAAWYERGTAGDAGTPISAATDSAPAAPARQRARELQARMLDRRAERARQARHFAQAERLRDAAARLRDGSSRQSTHGRSERTPETELDPTALERALDQLQEAQDDPETQRRVLVETLAQAQRTARGRQAQRDRHALERDDSPGQPVTAVRAGSASGLRVVRPRSCRLRAREQAIAVPVEQSNDPARTAATSATDAEPALLAGMWSRLAAERDQRATIRPAGTTLPPTETVPADRPVAVAGTESELGMHDAAVADTPATDGSRIPLTAGDVEPLTTAAAPLPIADLQREPARSPASVVVPSQLPPTATGTTRPLMPDAAPIGVPQAPTALPLAPIGVPAAPIPPNAVSDVPAARRPETSDRAPALPSAPATATVAARHEMPTMRLPIAPIQPVGGQPAPRAAQGLPVNGAPVIASTSTIDHQPTVQPARVTQDLALPQVSGVREPQPAPALPPVALARRPWKRGQGGGS